MANVYKPGLVQIRPRYSASDLSGHTPENILWFQSGTTTTPTLANLQSMTTIFDPAWANLWGSCGASNNSYLGSIATDWSSNTGLQYSSVGVFTPTPGTHGSTTQSSQVCILISYQIGVRYKGGHPRTYIPYISTTATAGSSGDEVVSTVITSMVNYMNAMIANMKGNATLGGQTQVIYRHRTNPSLATTYQFATFTVQGQTATQRRRVRRVAHH